MSNADSKPSYLRPDYDQSELLFDANGGVKAGTTSALVGYLTAHESEDPTFFKNFLIAFKSFMSVDELFDLLVKRFGIQPPSELSGPVLEEWTKLKQHVIRTRVLNVFTSLVTDPGLLEEQDTHIWGRIKHFAVLPEVNTFAAAKELVVLIERKQHSEDAPNKPSAETAPPPAPIMPKESTNPELLDIDPIELSRQFTIKEAALYRGVDPLRCLQHSRVSPPRRNPDTLVIVQLSNQTALWVAENILEREDIEERVAVVKHFISVADYCRSLQNFSTMTAITAALNTPTIRRLKRTWDRVDAQYMAMKMACEYTIDTNKNFAHYRSLLTKITPPCVPFIGVYLTSLVFIHQSAEDKLDDDMINFHKHLKAAQVVQDMKRWQAEPSYNFAVVAPIANYLEDALAKYQDADEYYEEKLSEQSLAIEPEVKPHWRGFGGFRLF